MLRSHGSLHTYTLLMSLRLSLASFFLLVFFQRNPEANRPIPWEEWSCHAPTLPIIKENTPCEHALCIVCVLLPGDCHVPTVSIPAATHGSGKFVNPPNIPQ